MHPAPKKMIATSFCAGSNPALPTKLQPFHSGENRTKKKYVMFFFSKKFRFFHRVTGFHVIHDILYSYGVKIPFTKYAYFFGKSFQDIHGRSHHNCTTTGIY